MTEPNFYQIQPRWHTWLFMRGHLAPDIKTAGITFLTALNAPWICALLNFFFFALFYTGIILYGGLFLSSCVSLLASSILAIIFAMSRESIKEERFQRRPLWITLGCIFVLPFAFPAFYMFMVAVAGKILTAHVMLIFAFYVILQPFILGQFFAILCAIWICEALRLWNRIRQRPDNI